MGKRKIKSSSPRRNTPIPPLLLGPIIHVKLGGFLSRPKKGRVKPSDDDRVTAGAATTTAIYGMCGRAIVCEAKRIPGKSGAWRLWRYEAERPWRVRTERDCITTMLGWPGITSVVTVISKPAKLAGDSTSNSEGAHDGSSGTV
jgi:hypothetical protein